LLVTNYQQAHFLDSIVTSCSQTSASLRRPWLTALGTDETADYNEDDSIPAHVKEQRGSNEPPLERAMSARTGLSRGESFDGGTQGSERSSRLMRSHAMQSVHLIMQPTMADKVIVFKTRRGPHFAGIL